MSVYKRSYRAYKGEQTSQSRRFGVLMRYAFNEVWSSKITNVLFVLCLVPTLVSVAGIYIANNETVRQLISEGRTTGTVLVDQRHFLIIMQVHCWCSLVLTAWIGPKLLAGELSNNSLPILFSHPISRLEYITAKFAVLAGMLVSVTMVPGLLLFLFQAHMSAAPWAAGHVQIATGIIINSLLWIALISFVALAVASWVKWRIVATGMVFAAIFVPAGTSAVFNQVMRTNSGDILNVPVLMYTLWRKLLQVPIPDYYARNELPLSVVLVALLIMIVCCMGALNARIRAREVVRG